ncbi:Uncharacterized protein OS=Pseudomonas putida S12 GN=RPPX_03510 PE=4 SV=1 [Gemmata massiliana]|uniref:Uncharacterized protein n=1 Tax=Gemmata massiliana TaxID=1210884 RepID=A0A6P2DCB3_9BACT|nr:hypothetical protein [Gemmata massiliana]VTR97995.1 Uncharacterized protein OS=Pseudomonas putida S12 GN=RPPX_03510 PE=4 SV=1 [Gemmata massiliana]
MNQFLLSFVAILGAVVLGTVRAGAETEAPANSEEVFIKEVQASGQAWQYSGVKLPAGYTAAITATGTWTINETWDKKVGAGGNSDFKAEGTYLKSGANEGSLLVRVGDTVTAFSKDDDVLRVDGPGKIYFCANDTATPEGVKRAELFVQGIPIQPAKDALGSGYQDNDGVIKARVAVGRSKKDGTPEK